MAAWRHDTSAARPVEEMVRSWHGLAVLLGFVPWIDGSYEEIVFSFEAVSDDPNGPLELNRATKKAGQCSKEAWGAPYVILMRG